jgi:hypothetical protein
MEYYRLNSYCKTRLLIQQVPEFSTQYPYIVLWIQQGPKYNTMVSPGTLLGSTDSAGTLI